MEMLPEYRSEEKGEVSPGSPSSPVAPLTPDPRAESRKLLKRVLIFVFRWANGLLFLLHAVDLVQQFFTYECVLMLKWLPPSLMVVASLGAFLAAKKLDSLVCRSFAFWANLMALAFHLYWIYRNLVDGEVA